MSDTQSETQPGFFQSVGEDVRATLERDPAATSWVEVLLCYPGLQAVWAHHLIHWLWTHGLHFVGRLLSQWVRFWTGVEIHPGAVIGRRLFIDHGMGVVIGETSVVGDDCTIYQGCTLGGTGKEKGKRHPTIQNNVTIGAGARILGNITIGENCRVGAGSVVLRDIPDNSTVVGVPGHIVLRNGKRVVITDPKEISDPLSEVIIRLAEEVRELRHRVAEHNHEPCGPDPDLGLDEEVRPEPGAVAPPPAR